MSKSIKLCVVNRNYPPDRGATGYYASRLVDYLKVDDSFEISVVTVGNRRDTNDVKYIKGSYEGKVKWRRLFSTYFEGRKLVKKALSTKADVYIMMTDPPFLNYWSSKLLKNKKWMLWSMDLYPEAFAANGLIDQSHVLFKHYESSLKAAPPSYIVSLGAAQLKHLQAKYYPTTEGLSLPIGIREGNTLPKEKHAVESVEKKVVFGYAGTIGEAHDAEAIVRIAKSLNPQNHSFVLCCKGSKSEDVTAQLIDFKHVIIKEELTEEELGEIDIHIVSLMDRWTHICVPSKALSALQKERPVLFIGKDESDTWQLINGAGWRLSQEYDILDFLRELTKDELLAKKRKAKKVSSELLDQYNKGLLQIKTRIEQLKSNS